MSTEAASNQVDQKTKYKVIGTRPIRHDGADKVTGKALYTSDVHLPNMAYGAFVRSPHSHARILSIDTSEADAMPGVLATMTSADLPDPWHKMENLGEGCINYAHLSGNVLARGKALYKGHAVAAVCATNSHLAEEAAAKIKVEYEPLPWVTSILDAMKDDAPLLHDNLVTQSLGEASTKPSNIAQHIHFEQGNMEEGWAAADLVIERELKTSSIHQGYIEPHVSIAMWNEDGRLKIWTATQGAFVARQQVAELLKIPVSQVLVIPCEIGGGFGGKVAVFEQPVAAVLSRKCGRPVKIAMRRDEVFEATGPTPGSCIRVKLGATNEGKLTAAKAWLAYDAGAFPGGMIGPGCMCILSCYDIPNAVVDGYDVVANKPKVQAYRAPGSTQATTAMETVMDELACKLNIDPIEFRLRNAAIEGTRRVDGPVFPRIGLVETLEATRDSDHWNAPLEGPNRGRGMACGFWFNAGMQSSATAAVNPDGTVTLVEGSTDIGGTRASIAMQLAETLGIAAEDVQPQVGDTDSVGYTDVTGGSRVTFATGLAAHHAGLDIQKQMIARAADLWECDAAEIKVENGVFRRNGDAMSFKELAVKLINAGEPIVGRASVAPQVSTNAFGAHVVDVEVDPETGKVTILRYTAVQDAGKAIHPSYVEGQLQGGAAQGIGWALNEEYFYDDQGHMRNASFLDYRMPTAYDLPMIDTIIVEVPNPDHPYGVRGVGEVSIVPPPAALAAAIHRATGCRIRELPMSPPKVWMAMQER
ncbi:MAG: xanthine dehydrogenase family protein molybdopterin-binding subunit [Pirellulaceae bacterium]|nr:xanthine dehydrogenase family protein molybdopterin-binding subunit [Pirellulaceae bacterium]